MLLTREGLLLKLDTESSREGPRITSPVFRSRDWAMVVASGERPGRGGLSIAHRTAQRLLRTWPDSTAGSPRRNSDHNLLHGAALSWLFRLLIGEALTP